MFSQIFQRNKLIYFFYYELLKFCFLFLFLFLFSFANFYLFSQLFALDQVLTMPISSCSRLHKCFIFTNLNALEVYKILIISYIRIFFIIFVHFFVKHSDFFKMIDQLQLYTNLWTILSSLSDNSEKHTSCCQSTETSHQWWAQLNLCRCLLTNHFVL